MRTQKNSRKLTGGIEQVLNTQPIDEVLKRWNDDDAADEDADTVNTCLKNARELSRNADRQQYYMYLVNCFFEGIPFQIALWYALKEFALDIQAIDEGRQVYDVLNVE